MDSRLLDRASGWLRVDIDWYAVFEDRSNSLSAVQ